MQATQNRPIRVLHAPVNYANQAQVLSAALREQGVASHLLRYQWEGSAAVKFYQDGDRVAQISRDDWFGDMLRVVQDLAHERFDIIHLWNRSLLWRYVNDFFNGMDLPYLRQAGARIAYRFTGYDLRRKSLELKLNPYTPYRYGFETNLDEDGQQRYLDSLAPYVDRFVVQDPEMQTYCPQATMVPRAIDLAAFPVAEAAVNPRPLVVHAPSQRLVKGSDFVLKAVEQLKEEGLAFDFLLIEGMPNAEALAHYRRADIIVDQLLIGWYGVLAMEGMALGKAVVAYIREDLVRYFRRGLPLLNGNPDTITAVLREAIRDAELRREMGRRGRAFVEEVHDSRAAAASAIRMYGEILAAPTTASLPNFGWQLRGAAEFRSRFDQDRLDQSHRRVADLEKQLVGQLEKESAKADPAEIEQWKQADANARWVAEYLNQENNLTTAFLRFARRCHERAADLAAEAYIAHGIQALLAADAVARAVGGRVYGDVVEMPSFSQRNERYDIDPVNLALLDQAFAGFVREADGISTVGWAIKEKLEEYGPRQVTVIPNYRRAEELQPSAELRERCGVGPDDRLLLASSSIEAGFDPIVEALTLLPDNIHLATLGAMPGPYRAKMDMLVERLGVGKRVHFLEPVPYERLASVSSGANVGLVAIDPALTNRWVSLPNRVFDYIASGLPMITPEVPDIARIVREHDLGVTLPQSSAAAWAEAIERVLADEPRLRANALATARKLTWESLSDALIAAYGCPKSATIMSFSDLTRHQRTRRIAETLVAKGVGVTICCPEPEDKAPPPEIAGVRFVFTPRYAVVPPRPGSPEAEAAASAPPPPVASPPPPIRGRILGLWQSHEEVAASRAKAAQYDELVGKLPSLRRDADRRLRVLQAPVNYANQAFMLNDALRAQGIDSRALLYKWEGNSPVEFYDESGGDIAVLTRRDWFGDILRIVQNIAAEGFDVIHFWNRSLLYKRVSDLFCGMDLPHLRQAGSRIAYRFTGYDLRRKSLELELNPYSPWRYGFVSGFEEENQQRYLEWLAPYVDRFVVQDPEMQTYCPQAQIIPRTLNLDQFQITETAPNERPLVVHAPSNRSVKGSDFVLRAVEILKEENRDFDFVLVENMPNAEALALYRRADIVIDQLLVGWYGVLAMEAMALGKAVIAYIRGDLTGYFGERMPLLNANPHTLTSVLRDAVGDADMRREMGRRGRAFVEAVHDSRVVARSAAAMYEKMLQTPALPAVPNFAPLLGHSLQIRQWYDDLVYGNAAEAAEIAKLRTAAAQYEELKAELPGLRYRAQRYDQIKDQLPQWKSKAEQFDRFSGALLGKLALPLLRASRSRGAAAPSGEPPTADAEVTNRRD